jgi:hypothetical protein
MPLSNRSAYFSIALRLCSCLATLLRILRHRFTDARKRLIQFVPLPCSPPAYERKGGPNRSVSGLRAAPIAPEKSKYVLEHILYAARICERYLAAASRAPRFDQAGSKWKGSMRINNQGSF